MIEFYDDTDILVDAAAPIRFGSAAAASGNPQAGVESDPMTLRMWSDRGNPAGEVLEELLLVVRIEDPARPDTFVARGLAPQDELWISAAFVGQGGDARQALYTTSVRSLGAGAVIPFPDLYPDSWRDVTLTLRAPSFAAAQSYRWMLAVDDARAVPLPGPELERGIVHGVGDPARTALVDGGELTLGPAVDQVGFAARQVLLGGDLAGKTSDLVAFDQVDGAAAALADGDAYIALVSQGPEPTVTVTKGVGAAEPDPPSVPAGHVLLAQVRVDGSTATGTELDASSILRGPTWDRLRVVAGVGLSVDVHPGGAVGGGAWRIRQAVDNVPVTASATSYVWQTASGDYAVTATDAAPETSALPLAAVTADATDVTDIVDRRGLIGQPRVLEIRGAPADPVDTDRHDVGGGQIERVVLVVSELSGTSGTTRIDVEIDGASIWPSSATEDLRPAVAFDAVSVRAEAFPEVSTLPAGARITVRTVEQTDVAPASIEVFLVTRG